MWRATKQYRNYKIYIKALGGDVFEYSVPKIGIKGKAIHSVNAHCFAIEEIEEFINKK
jgi:hypothetical protein